MLIRTSSGNTSVGHLSHSPHGFSPLFKPDVTFQCGPLLFPVHSVLLSASSKFFTDFFTFVHGQKAPDVISLDAVKCDVLSPVSLGYYLDFVYGGLLPDCDTVCEAVDLLRLSAYLGNTPLTTQLGAQLAARLPDLPEAELLEVFRAAADLKLRTLVTDCLVLLLPQFGRCTADATVTSVIDRMDAVLSKAVLAQLVLQGTSIVDVAAPTSKSSCQPDNKATASPIKGVVTPGRQDSGEFAAALTATPPASLDLERLKRQFVRVLTAKGWGQ